MAYVSPSSFCFLHLFLVVGPKFSGVLNILIKLLYHPLNKTESLMRRRTVINRTRFLIRCFDQNFVHYDYLLVLAPSRRKHFFQTEEQLPTLRTNASQNTFVHFLSIS